MRQCSRYGIDLTKRCNWRCSTCFYRHCDDFNSSYDKPFETVRFEIHNAKERGCDHIVAVGWGEPMLYPQIKEFVEYCKEVNLHSSIITNGSASIKRYEELYEAGLDHLHISVHGLGEVLDKISEKIYSGEHQKDLIRWLSDKGRPYRTNTTMQLINYKQLPEIASFLIENNVWHTVMLNFLPHYQWSEPEKLRLVAVHPKELAPYIEKTSELLEDSLTYQTVRYFPMCHLQRKYWKYVTNAINVLYDPYEWEYNKHGLSDQEFLNEAIKLACVTGINSIPCSNCDLSMHCGHWNKFYANGFEGADLKPVKLDKNYNFGHFFSQNPINTFGGQIV